jgi:hypothetical protein
MIRVEVTADDIAKGGAMSCGNCPVARALTRLGVKVEVFGAGVDFYVKGTVGYGDYIGYAVLPVEAREFIHAFDTDREVAPFTFEIELPDAVIAAMKPDPAVEASL